MPKTINSCNNLILNGFQKQIEFHSNKIYDVFLTVLRNRRLRKWRVTENISLAVSTVSSFVPV